LILHRGAMHRVRLSPGEGHEQQGLARPCLIVHRQSLRNVGTAIVIPLTTQRPRAGYPLTVYLPAGTGGNPVECWARVTQIRTVSAARFQEPAIGRLSEAELTPIKRALIEVLDLGV
jgi:mRNA-degrading endonuclease toxin of MazEF toxin-antitoxin module